MTPPPEPTAADWRTGANRSPRRRNEILRRLHEAYPEASLALRFQTPFELLCAAMLAAQSTDASVNRVTPELFRRWPDALALARADETDVADAIRSVNYYRTKAARLVAASRVLVAEHDGRVPSSRDALEALPGVGRKTATLVANHAFDLCAGIVVDTHVARVGSRLDWAQSADPAKMADELEALIPRKEWRGLQVLLAAHGREVCRATKPKCPACPVRNRCYWPERTA